MLYRSLMLAAMLLAAGAANAQTLIADRAVLLLRHGIRPPTHEPALDPAIAPTPWPTWDVPDGYLTPHGAAAITLLAAYDRAFLASQHIVPATGCPGDVTIYADIEERTMKTGEAYATGFAPGCNLPTKHADGTYDPLFHPLDQPDKNFDAEIAKADMLKAAGGSLAAIVTAHAALFQQMQNALAPAGTAFLRLPAAITIKAAGRLPKLSGPLDQGASGAEDFLLEYLEGKPLSEVGWGRVNAAEIPVLLALHPLAYTLTARPPYIAERTAAPLAHRILAALSAGHGFTVIAGHDTNIAELAGLLHLHWHLGGYPADDPPPGGGFFLLLSHDAKTGTKYVTVSYQVQTMDQIRNLIPLSAANPPAIQPLAIPGCGNATAPTACTLPVFAKLIASAARN